jgi:hypothetical protein
MTYYKIKLTKIITKREAVYTPSDINEARLAVSLIMYSQIYS